jgi:hypothetical protein
MKITFIRPSLFAGEVALEPRVFSILSWLTDSDIERVLYDERLG